MLPLLILSAVVLAVVGAAAYALIGKPRSAKGRKQKREIISGFQIAGGILLGGVLMGALVIGTGIALFGIESLRVSRPAALILAVASLGTIMIMMQRWAKYFPGWIAYGVLSGLIMTSTGHLLNNPSIPVERSVALTMTGLSFVTAAVCLRFTKDYALNVVDRIALTVWVLCFTVGANAKQYGLAAFGVGCAGLVVAWLYHQYFRAASRRRKVSA